MPCSVIPQARQRAAEIERNKLYNSLKTKKQTGGAILTADGDVAWGSCWLRS